MEIETMLTDRQENLRDRATLRLVNNGNRDNVKIETGKVRYTEIQPNVNIEIERDCERRDRES